MTTETKGVISRCQVGPSQAVIVVPDRVDTATTNVVHCHPPKNRPSLPHEIDNCRPYLHREIAIVEPRLIIALGRDARATLEQLQPDAPVLPWPFTRPRRTPTATDPTRLLFAPHPSWIARQPRTEQDDYVAHLTSALKWVFTAPR